MEDLTKETQVVEEKEITETPPVVKMFTQAEMDKIIDARFAKIKMKEEEEKGKLAKELEEIKAQKEKEIAEVKAENAKYVAEKQLKEKERILKELNVDDDFIKIVMDKIPDGKNFAENAKTFVDGNPKIRKDNFIPINSGARLEGGEGTPDFNKMTAQEYIEYRKKYGIPK